MDIGSVLLGLALLLVIAFLVARPLIERPAAPEQPISPAEQLLAARERVLTQLRDLDFDHSMSKINEVDYAAQRAQLVAEGVALLKQLDALGLASEPVATQTAGVSTTSSASRAPASSRPPVDEIEAAVAALRAKRSAAARTALAPAAAEAEIEASVAERRANKPAGSEKVFCGQCGAEAAPGDRFCARCGAPLAAPASGLRQAKVQN